MVWAKVSDCIWHLGRIFFFVGGLFTSPNLSIIFAPQREGLDNPDSGCLTWSLCCCLLASSSFSPGPLHSLSSRQLPIDEILWWCILLSSLLSLEGWGVNSWLVPTLLISLQDPSSEIETPPTAWRIWFNSSIAFVAARMRSESQDSSSFVLLWFNHCQVGISYANAYLERHWKCILFGYYPLFKHEGEYQFSSFNKQWLSYWYLAWLSFFAHLIEPNSTGHWPCLLSLLWLLSLL